MARASGGKGGNGKTPNLPAVVPPTAMPTTLRLVLDNWPSEGLPETKILPEHLDQGRRFVEARLRPCGDEAVAHHLGPLWLCTARPNDESLTMEQRGAILAEELATYQRLLRDLPSDLLERACDEHARRSKWFPKPAELREIAEAEFTKRQDWLRRIVQLQEEAKKPARAKVFQPEPEEVRLIAAIERWRKLGADVVMGVNLKRNAVDAEKRLAEIHNRAVEAWALEVAPEAVVLPPSPPPRSGRHAETRHAVDVPHTDVAGPWQAGKPLYHEEPPPPTDIAEGVDYEAEIEP